MDIDRIKRVHACWFQIQLQTNPRFFPFLENPGLAMLAMNGYAVGDVPQETTTENPPKSTTDKAFERLLASYATNTVEIRRGWVYLTVEAFGLEKDKCLPLKIYEMVALKKANCERSATILLCIVEADGGEPTELLFHSDMLEPRHIRRQFDRANVSLGFNEKKERETLHRMVLEMFKNAKVVEIPKHHGWNWLNERPFYAFPDTLTWKEVEEWICEATTSPISDF